MLYTFDFLVNSIFIIFKFVKGKSGKANPYHGNFLVC